MTAALYTLGLFCKAQQFEALPHELRVGRLTRERPQSIRSIDYSKRRVSTANEDC